MPLAFLPTVAAALLLIGGSTGPAPRHAVPAPMPASVRMVAHVGRAGELTRLDAPVRWPAGWTIQLDGPVSVDAGGTLTIEAGTRVEAAVGAYIIVARDGRIEATGTQNEPIVMTCTAVPKYPGCWGGLIIHGYARVNSGAATSPASPRGGAAGCLNDVDPVSGGARFGGCNDADDSGILTFLRIEYAERGLHLAAVGSGSVVHDVQANRTRGEGVLITGGAVNVRDLFLTANGTGMRWTGGWRGTAQFIAVQQDILRFAAGIVGQNGTTATAAAADALPRSNPTLYNLTIIAQSDPANANHATARALVLERGTAGTIRNVFFYAPNIALDVVGTATCMQLNAASLTLRNVLIGGATALGAGADAAGCAQNESALLSDASQFNAVLPGAGGLLKSENDLFLPDLRPVTGSALATAQAATPSNVFITAAAYVGAMPAAGAGGVIPWFSGWTSPAPPPAPIPNGVIVGVVSSPFRGILGNTVVTDATTGASTIANASGRYVLTLPAGTALLDVSAVPAGCPEPVTRAGTVRPTDTTTLNLTVDCPPLPGTSRIAAGDGFACGISDQGAYCWGENALGQLGNGTTLPSLVPVAVSGSFTSLSAGAQHACGVQANGAVRCWGEGSQGQIGDGAGVSRTTPTLGPVGGYVMVTTGGAHSCALAADGRAYCWGANTHGQLGNGTTVNALSPSAVTGAPAFATIAAGRDHTCALDLTGAAWCWGANAQGQLGDGTTLDRTQPVAVSGGNLFKELAGGGSAHTCASGATGIVRCWGANSAGQLGNGTTVSSSTPVVITAPTLSHLALGATHSCGIGADAVSYCWGENVEGEVGDGTTANRSAPSAASASARFNAVTAGNGFTCAVTFGAVTGEDNVIVISRRSLLCWGRNTTGQFGRGTTTAALTPTAAATGLTFP